MPAGGPGQYLPPGDVREFTRPLREGDAEGAAAAFLDVFAASYGVDDLELEDVVWLKVWPDGTPEPE